MVSEKSQRLGKASVRLICALLAFVLSLSSFSHLRNPYEFLGVVHSYKMVPRIVAELIATILPNFELTVAIAILFFARQRLSALVICVVLFSIYSIAQIWVFSIGLNVACGCFGSMDDDPVSLITVGRTLLLVAISVTGIVLLKILPSSEVVDSVKPS
jgi:hypothetical protein